MRRILYAALVVFPILVLLIFPKWTVDDAYIYYRYADNFAKHGQLNWNIGERPVEGYTGVALPVLLAGFIRLGFSPIDASHAIGVFGYGLGLVMLILILRRLRLGTVGQLVGAGFYVTTPILYTHVFSGLETTLFFGLLFAAMYVALAMIKSGCHRRTEIIGLLMLLIFSLTRPEGLAFSGLLLAAVAIAKLVRDRRECLRFVSVSVMFYGAPVVWYFYWRWSYYGQILPNTFYVKTNIGFTLANLADAARFLIRYFTAPAMAALLLITADIDWLWRKIKNRELAYDYHGLLVVLGPYAVFVMLLFIQFANSHLSMNYAHRFYLPLLPLLWMIIAFSIDGGAKALSASRADFPLKHRFIVVAMLVFALYQAAFFLAKLKDEIRFAGEEQQMLGAEHIAIGKFLKANLPSSEWLVVYMDAGAIPYFSGLKTVDFGAINDTTLTHGDLSPRERIDYFYAHNPGAVVFTSTDKDKVDYGDEVAAIMADPRFKNYVLAKKYLSPLPPPSDYQNYHEWLFLRKDLAVY